MTDKIREILEGRGVMRIVIAIDPGTTQSAYVVWDGTDIREHDIIANDSLEAKLYGIYSKFPLYDDAFCKGTYVAIEKIASMGMAVGEAVFETVFWTGRFYGAALEDLEHSHISRIPRSEVKMALCGSMQAKDANIRQAIINRFEPELMPKQRPKGVLKGIKADEWQALAVAIVQWDKLELEEKIVHTDN